MFSRSRWAERRWPVWILSLRVTILSWELVLKLNWTDFSISSNRHGPFLSEDGTSGPAGGGAATVNSRWYALGARRSIRFWVPESINNYVVINYNFIVVVCINSEIETSGSCQVMFWNNCKYKCYPPLSHVAVSILNCSPSMYYFYFKSL